MAASLKTVFGARGPLAKRLPNFSQRAEQLALAEAIETALQQNRHCLAEAGTGVGKTMAYLVPLVRWLEKTGGRAVISTHTIALQSQLVERDIPALLNALESDLTAGLMKGRQNFLCLQELELAAGELWTFGDPLFKQIQRWSNETETGDVAELDFTFSGWSEIAAHADTCRQRECRHYDRCFYYKARKDAEFCQLIVVNHALLFADLRLRQANPGGPTLIPRYDALIFDEAHHVDEIATRSFGLEWNSRRVPMLIARCKRVASLDARHLGAIEGLHQRMLDPFLGSDQPEGFIDEVLSTDPQRAQFVELRDAVRMALDALAKDLTHLADSASKQSDKERASGLARMASRAATELQAFTPGQADEAFFLWYQTRRNRLGQALSTLVRTPYAIAETLQENLLDKAPTVAFVSATLATGGGFHATRERLGLNRDDTTPPVETIQGSPFDFAQRCLLYIPRHLATPNASDAYAESCIHEIRALIRAAKGRTFVLFTSHRMLQRAKQQLADGLGYPLFVQGEMPNPRLVAAFQESGAGVLLGTSSFWEGVDVPGDALSCVILDKLPFATPDSPPQRAREQRIVAAGGDAFSEYSLPRTELRLKQGFGRLLRTATDRGVVAILDSRLWSKGYGRQLVASLPPAPRTDRLEEVEAFFQNPDGKTPETSLCSGVSGGGTP